MSGIRIGVEAVNLASRVRGDMSTEEGVLRGSTNRRGGALPAGEASGFLRIADRLTKWIPAESLALYLPGVSLLRTGHKPSAPALWFVLLITAVTPIFVLLGAWGTRRRVGAETWLAALLSIFAFAIWSLSVPFNGWQAFSVISETSGNVAVVAAVVGLLFGQLAEALVTHKALSERA